jgi:hypothetical protein
MKTGETINVDDDKDLSLVAVGLWHRLKAQSVAGRVDRSELLLVQQSPTAWGPERGVQLEDVEAALSELMAIGYAQDSMDGQLALFYELE